MIKLPGLIDIHVHFRDPGETHKEDFFTGTMAALSGGYTTVIDMPNNKKPIITLKTLKEKINLAKKKIVCDIGFYAGSLGDNLDELMKMELYVFGLKLYLNKTTGNYLIDIKKLEKIFDAWKSEKPILFHAESDVIEKVLELAKRKNKKIHICHVSAIKDMEKIIAAKKQNLKVTCGVTPHHLFLTKKDELRLGPLAMMKPPITSGFCDYIWEKLDFVDVIESDHAPHTIEEKKSDKPPFGVPNLETTLPLLITAIFKKKLTFDKLIELCFENPKKIFKIKTDKDTYIEVDENEEFFIDNKNLKTKCGWSPYNGWQVRGKVKKVFLRGKKVYDNGEILVNKGYGCFIKN